MAVAPGFGWRRPVQCPLVFPWLPDPMDIYRECMEIVP